MYSLDGGVVRGGTRHGIEAETFHRQPDLSDSAQAVQLTEHLIPSQIRAFQYHFLELATWGTNDDFHDPLPSGS